ncbi:MAG TPA: phosphoenolpyruvate--protein phosphotransferase, partial [candidate division Zixibacteria bacterium]|nr:phosphoenolpyruvate--protein phosphotransferase [candidate division Zixibacteria bacterium]
EAWQKIPNNTRIIADAVSGRVIVNPSQATWEDYQRRRRRLGPTVLSRIKKLGRIPPVTADGVEVAIGANLTLPGPADEILAHQRVQVGLYRTEFLYLANGAFPSEEAQYDYYRRIARTFGPTPVVLRTFDLGGDKVFNGGGFPVEDNPALGLRGIRTMLAMREEFRTQIRAILRASAHGNLRILLPMVTELEEIERARKIISQEKQKLRREAIPFGEDVPLGIMIEVPSAALTADTLSRRVDFVSIGTNDLTQYTLAADRMNSHVAHLYNALHPAVLNLVWHTVKTCRANGVPVTVCGELAGQRLALPLLIGMGVDVLSMAPARLVEVCRLIRKINSTRARDLVGPVLAGGTLQAVVDRLRDYRETLEHVDPRMREDS